MSPGAFCLVVESGAVNAAENVRLGPAVGMELADHPKKVVILLRSLLIATFH